MNIDINSIPPAAGRPGRGRSGFVTGAGFLLLASAWACLAPVAEDADGHDPDRLAVLSSEVDQVLAPTFAEFADKAKALEQAIGAYGHALDGDGDVEAARADARVAFVAALEVWQRAELLQVGPTGPAGEVVGGENLRDEIYSWPTVSPCRIDQETATLGYEQAEFFSEALVNVRGLDAVEYLLFADSASNACEPTDTLNTDGSWATLGADAIERRRVAYATGATQVVRALADRLAETWKSGRGDFALWLTAPGESGSPYGMPREGVGDLFEAVAYVDQVLHRHKLMVEGVEDLESPWADLAKEHVRANLQGLQQMLWGGPSADQGTGFDDLLVAMGQDALASELMATVVECLAAVDAISGSFSEAVSANPAALTPVAAAVAKLTELLEGPVAAALTLQPPGEGGGDAD